MNRKFILFLILLATVAALAWKSGANWADLNEKATALIDSAKSGIDKSVSELKEAVDPDKDLQLQALPANSTEHTYFRGRGGIPLKIINRSSELHTIIKLEDYNTGTPVAKYFVRANQSIEKYLPAGRFRVKMASGKDWYGEPELFGSATLSYGLNKPLVVTQSDTHFFINHSIIEVNIDLPIWSPDRANNSALQRQNW